MRLFLWGVTLLVCCACSTSQGSHHIVKKTKNEIILLKKAEEQALPAGQKILKVGRKMAVEKKEIIRGSCWDYINVIYNRAGYPAIKRQTILKGKKNSGPYAKHEQIQAGDWLYFVNHSYHNVEHSGVFIRWSNKSKRSGLILSYGGQNRKEPGRYREYDLSHVYTIIRPK